MIINHERKFIFVHIHKTAGSSIRNSLLKNIPGSSYLGYHHSFAETIPGSYKDYFKFCIVRNPWDRLVSWYYSIINLKASNNFKEYIESNCKDFSGFLKCTNIIDEIRSAPPPSDPNTLKIRNLPYPKSISFNQLDYISDSKGNVLVNYVGKFENLSDSLEYICDKISLNIPLRKDKVGPVRNPYKDFYSTQDKDLVTQLYKRDIEHFNYEF